MGTRTKTVASETSLSAFVSIFKIKEVNVLQPRPVQVDNNSAKSDEYYDEQRFTETQIRTNSLKSSSESC